MKKKKESLFEKASPVLFGIAAIVVMLLCRFFKTKFGNIVYNKTLKIFDRIKNRKRK